MNKDGILRLSLTRLLDVFFDREEEKKHPGLSLVWIFLLYVIGLALWGWVFDWRHTSLNYLDWAELFLPRFQVIKEALIRGVLPLHVSDIGILHNLSDRFFTSPDIVTTPQMILLIGIDADTFAFFDVLFHYTIATLALVCFKKRFNIGLFPFSILLFLFNFNGHIIAHYVVGHANWAGYFIIPIFFLLLFDLIENKAGWLWVIKMSFVSFYVILAGSQHHFTWMMLFLLILGILNIRRYKWALIAILSSVFLSAVRLVPLTLIVSEVTSKNIYQFRSGYPDISELISSLAVLRPIDYEVYGPSLFTGYWEYNYFIGIIGFLFLLFGLFNWMKDLKQEKRFAEFLVPAGVVFLLSMGFVYEYTLFQVPVFASERVISRMASIPISLFLMISTVYFQKWWNDNAASKLMRWLGSLSLLTLLNDLVTQIRLWGVKSTATYFQTTRVRFDTYLIQNHPDPEYIKILIIGVVLTILTIVVLSSLLINETYRVKRLK